MKTASPAAEHNAEDEKIVEDASSSEPKPETSSDDASVANKDNLVWEKPTWERPTVTRSESRNLSDGSF
ncbi:MAG: hypothetical protein WA843_04695, partial [Candidatus Saccharimonadales bacterium]